MRRSVILVFAFIAVQALAQPSDVLNKLRSYTIFLTDITLNTQPLDFKHAFTMQVETADRQHPVTYTAAYDPSKSPAWIMTSWNGKTPDKSQEDVLKHRVGMYATKPVKVDEKTLKSSQQGDYLIVSFRVDPTTVPFEYMYLKDCNGQAYINTISGKLEKTIWENFKPTINQSLHLNTIREEVFFEFADGGYRVTREVQYIGSSVKTQSGDISGEVNQILTYSNYRKL